MGRKIRTLSIYICMALQGVGVGEKWALSAKIFLVQRDS